MEVKYELAKDIASASIICRYCLLSRKVVGNDKVVYCTNRDRGIVSYNYSCENHTDYLFKKKI